MKLVILALAGAVSAQKINCPTLPKAATPEEMRKGVPIRPQDIPSGCSPLEVLIGKIPIEIIMRATESIF